MAELDVSQSGGKKGGKKRSKKSAGRVDLTAMVDLGFLLITFFMLTTTFNKPKAMDVIMPSKEDLQDDTQDDVPASKVISLILGKEDKIYWYEHVDPGQPPQMQVADFNDPKDIEKVIFDKQKAVAAKWGNKDEMICLIKTMDDAKYKNLVAILDEMPITDTKRYAIVDLAAPEKEMVEKLYADPNFDTGTSSDAAGRERR